MDEEDVRDENLWQIYQELMDDSEESLSEYSPSYGHLLHSQEAYSGHELIGVGALKQVSKCFDERSNRYVAYAQLKPELGKEFFDAFIHEAWLTTGLTHPNIIKTYEVNLDPVTKRPFFTMDLRSNSDLRHFTHSTPDLRSKLEAFLRVCDALSFAHSKGILHLDIKPENIQCDHFGEVVVCDWGLGKRVSDSDELTGRLSDTTGAFNTLYGEVRGTPGYMAPEQVLNEEKDERTDVFSLGAVLFFILTGEAPFRGQEKEEVFRQTVCGLIQTVDGIDERLYSVCEQALHVLPQDRYQSVLELRQDVARYLDGFTITVERTTFIARGLRFILRHQRMAWMTLALILSVSVVSLVSVVRHKRQTQEVASAQRDKNELMVQMRELNTEYQVFENAVLESRDNLADKLSGVAIQAIRESLGVAEYSMNNDPVGPLLEASLLLDKSLKLRPSNNTTFEKWVHVNFIMLNFSEILTRENISSSWVVQHMYDVASQFPDFAYDNKVRPSLQQLEELFNYAESNNKGNIQNYESVLRFDWGVRKDKDGYTDVALSLIRRINSKDNKAFSVDYDENKSSLRVYSEAPFNAYSSLSVHYRPLLSYLALQNFALESPSHFNLVMLDHTMFERVDLVKVNFVKAHDTIQSKTLKVLRLPRKNKYGKDSVEEVYKYLHTSDLPKEFTSTRGRR